MIEGKRKKARLLKFPKPKVADDSQFIKTLVWALEQAREGKVLGYAMVYIVNEEDQIRTIEAAKAFEEVDKHHVLGAIRRMEASYMKREWPDD